MKTNIRVGDMLHALRKNWKTVVLSLLAGLLIGIFLVGVQFIRGSNPDYKINGSFAIISRGTEGKFTGSYESSNDFYLSEDMVDSVSYVLKSRRNLNDVIQSLGLKYSTGQLSENLSFQAYNETQIVEATLQWKNKKEGIRILNQVFKQAEKTLPKTLQVGSISVINTPEASNAKNSKIYLHVIIIMFLLGGCAGIGMILLDIMFRPTLIMEQDMEDRFGIDLISSLPTISENMIQANPDDKETEEKFSSASYILRNLLGTKNNCFYITSTQRGEGRTYIASNLAYYLSQMEKKVLLIDLDISSPNLYEMFGEKPDFSRTLNALYREEALISEIIYPINGYLDIIPATRERNQIALSKEMRESIKKLISQYDYVIIDASPVGESSDVLGLKQLTDTALFVVQYDSTRIPDMKEAIDKLDKSGTRILGCIINGVEQKKNRMKRVKKQESHEIENILEEKKEFYDDMYTPEPKTEKTDSDIINELIRISLDEEEKQ